MKICLAQHRPRKGHVQENIAQHINFISTAIAHQADAIFFPELSITGYEPALANQLINSPSDPELNEFQKLADKHEIIIGLGFPTQGKLKPRISMVIYGSNAKPILYSKQILHKDEVPIFEPGEKQELINVKGKLIAPAICFESLIPAHDTQVAELGASIYLASVAKPYQNILKAFKHYPKIAQKFKMTVMMVNCTGYCDNFNSAGQSGIWNENGKLLAQLNENERGILCYDTRNQSSFKINLD